MGLSADDFLNSSLEVEEAVPLLITPIGMENYGATQAAKTTKKDYRTAYAYINVTSYSQRRVLRKCAREFQLMKTPEVSAGSGLGLVNIDFVFGHSVGAGIQTYLVTRNKSDALWATFLGWSASYDAEYPKKGKSAAFAALAVEKFMVLWEQDFADHWEIVSINGKPATELTFFVDCENGYYHAGHIDAILRHKVTGKYIVLEIKTTALRNPDEAQHGNSEQSLGYSIIVDKIAQDLQLTREFDVLYFIYSSVNREFSTFKFTKSRTDRIEWLQALLLEHAQIGTYRKLEFFPQNGDSCWSFGGRCIHYGICGLKSMQKTTFKELILNEKKDNLPEPVDFIFTLSDLTEASVRGVIGG